MCNVVVPRVCASLLCRLAPDDYIRLSGRVYGNSDCPRGVFLSTSDTVEWHSDGNQQGNPNRMVCQNAGLCAEGAVRHGIGGGWEICFEE